MAIATSVWKSTSVVMALKNESSQNQGSLLERWLSLNKAQETKTSITRLPAGQPAPLSSGQQKLWFLQQLYPENPFYNYTEAYRFRGKLNIDNLVQSFRLVAARHDILRTIVRINEGEAVQVVGETTDIDITTFDRQNLPSAKLEDIQVLVTKEANRLFDLNRGPLARLIIVPVTEDDHVAIITMHHIITDEWSLGILRDEWALFYDTLQQGNTPSAEPLPIQYADYANWQKTRQVDPADLAYWREKLEGKLPVLSLPSDRSRPAIPSFAGGFCKQLLPADLSEQIKNLAKKTNTTMFVLLLAVYKVLLYRYSGQEDIPVGTPFNGRDQVSLEKLIGFFIDTLVLRSDLSAETRFIDLLAEVRQTSLDAFSHKNVPFETLVRELKPERYTSVNPLFQVMFVYHKAPSLPSFGPGLDFEQAPFDSGSAKFDLTLHMSEENDQLSATFEYAKDLFDHRTIERMQDHLKVLLEGIAENPEMPIAALPLLSGAERDQILNGWNNTSIPFESDLLIHEIISRQALKKPEEPAVVFQGGQLTYKQLEEKADAVAACILEKWPESDMLVGLYTERSLDLIVGILGILKAGCAYLPLDPEYPAERIHFMVQDAGMPVILTHERLISHFSEAHIALLTFEEITRQTSQPVPALTKEVSRDTPAYVIYTSGSAGQPKGVRISHSNLLHSTLARLEYYPESPKSFLLLSSFAFDSSVAGIFWTLSTGGLLVLSEKRIEQDINQLANLVSKHQVTHTLLLPSLYTLLLQHAPPGSLDSLRSVIVAGEACMPSLCTLHETTLEDARLYNEYGPTEASVWCTVHKIQKQDAGGPVPIGRPIPNTQIYILDDRLQPVPVGVAGELYVAGAGLAKGYLNQPEFSAGKFVPNPFGDNPKSKMYKTGDMARFRSDGVIEFLGRADNQVKIRGFRIELSEINETLKQVDGVRDVAVLVRQDPGVPLIKDPDTADTLQLVACLEGLEKDEAMGLLKSVEKLSESELDYMLDEMKKSNK